MNTLFTIESSDNESHHKGLFNWNKLTNETIASEDTHVEVEEDKPKRKRATPKKEPLYKYDDGPKKLEAYQSNESYNKKYEETQSILKGTIADIDDICRTVAMHLSKLNSSASSRNYRYITDLTNTQAALINSKISAIREMNSSITNANRLDLNRAKDLRMSEDKQDNDKYIMDLYNALINTPINNGARLGPTMVESTTKTDSRQYMPYGNDDYGYEEYMRNMSPEQNRMFMEGNPNIQTVVVYNQTTGERKFDVVDTRTNESIPNMPIPDRSFLEDMTISFKSMTAKNTNTNTTYPLVVVGEDPLSKY